MKRFFVVLSVFLVLGGAAAFYSRTKPTTEVLGVKTEQPQFSVQQVISFYGNTSEPQPYTVTSGETALELLARSATVEIEESSYGKLVKSINGVVNGTDNKYWIYSVNGEEAKVGAGQYVLKPNDLVTWEFKAYGE